eukprot:SAG22_NODE_20732_length_263_cov_0.634146_1_plen_28_part_01
MPYSTCTHLRVDDRADVAGSLAFGRQRE